MRRDKRTGLSYSSYIEWLRDGHMIFLMGLMFGYLYYLVTTEPE